ncbi:SseB family protein [Paracoccaceae bacterium Fryx2]|nr:SseB family protein [Paracoccaceae bacterium Fryx2]
MTALDQAHAAMLADPEDDAARLRFYAQIADGEMVLLLEAEAEGDVLTPRVFELEDGPVVLIFDHQDRLAEFAGQAVAYAALPGRVIAAQLAGQGIGLGVNLGVAPSSMLLPPAAVDWLAATLQHAPDEVEAVPQAFHAPQVLPAALRVALEGRLARAGGLASHVLLAGVTYQGGRRGQMLAFVGAVPEAEAALARAAAEALTFSGVEAGEMDVTFVAPGTATEREMARVGLRFDIATPARPAAPAPDAPVTIPPRPPRLR